MLRSLYTAVSGVLAHQTYLDVTGHNVSNVNTVGFKRDVVQFADMLYQTKRNEAGPVSPPGGVNPAQVGLGVRTASISPNFVQGALQMTEIPTDMAIQGEGFFIVSDGKQNLYTRAGNFALDRDGNLVMQGNGYMVQGYQYNGTELAGALSSVNIPIGDVMPAKATTNAMFRSNLDSRSPVAAEDIVSHKDMFTVYYDEQNKPIHMAVEFRKAYERPADPTGDPPTDFEIGWSWRAYFVDSTGAVLPYGGGEGELTFGPNGNLTSGNSGSVTANFGSIPGGANGSIAMDFNGLTGFASNSTARMYDNDGYRSGSLTGWSTSDYGLISGMYTNGQTRPVAEIPLATFRNPQGLTQVGKTCFAVSANSGQPNIRAAGWEGVVGLIKGRTIEMSNVDLSEEFVNLIRSQRGLQANSRAVTTSDRILEVTLGLKR